MLYEDASGAAGEGEEEDRVSKRRTNGLDLK